MKNADAKKLERLAELCRWQDTVTIRFDQMKPAPRKEGAEAPETCSVEIDMLRTGQFVRKFWGMSKLISITEEMMDRMIQNFEDGVLDRQVALDINHQGEQAYGWLESLRKEKRDVKGRTQTYLIGTWSINAYGKEMIGNKGYCYFSIEFVPNYEDREALEVIKGPEGEEIPMGMKQYGPTIVGGALTNRPFIPNMNPVQFSEKDKEAGVSYMFEEGEKTPEPATGTVPGGVVESITFTTVAAPSATPPVAQQNADKIAGQEKTVVSFLSEAKKSTLFDISGFKRVKEREMKFTAAPNVIKFMEKQLAGMTDKDSQQFKDLSSELEAAKAEFAQSEKAEAAVAAEVAAVKAENQKLSQKYDETVTKAVVLENQVKDLAADMAMERERRRQAELNDFTASLTRKGHSKGVVAKAKQFLLADKSGATVVKFTEGEKEVALSLRDVITELLEAVPEGDGSRVPLSAAKDLKGDEFVDDGEIELAHKTEKFEDKWKDAIASGVKKGFGPYNQKGKSKVADSDKQ